MFLRAWVPTRCLKRYRVDVFDVFRRVGVPPTSDNYLGALLLEPLGVMTTGVRVARVSEPVLTLAKTPYYIGERLYLPVVSSV